LLDTYPVSNIPFLYPIFPDGAYGVRDVVIGLGNKLAYGARLSGQQCIHLVWHLTGDDGHQQLLGMAAFEHWAPSLWPALEGEHETRSPWLRQHGAIIGTHVNRPPTAAII